MKRKHKKRIKLIPLPKLHKKARKVFAKWIVLRDRNICFTCGKFGNQAGHFIHRNRYDFHEDLNRCQCLRCNFFEKDSHNIYTMKMIDIYGKERAEKWEQEKNRIIKYSREELNQIIEKYKEN